MTARARAVLVAIPLVTAAVGLAIASMIGAPPGADHSCPPSAPLSACRYPPDTARWVLIWTFAGLAIGAVASVAIAGLTIAGARRERREAGRPITGSAIDADEGDQG